MTVVIQQKYKKPKVKDLYLNSPVVVQVFDVSLLMTVQFTIEEDSARQWISDHNQEYKRERYKFWFEYYKKLFNCVICKNDKSTVLQFHHLHPEIKRYSISTMVCQCMKLRDIQAELKKCVAVCSNCHIDIENGSISYEYLLKKSREEYKESLRPGEFILEDFPEYMLENLLGGYILYKYDDAYLRRYRILLNFNEEPEHTNVERHPDYTNFCKKYIESKDPGVDMELYEDDELGEFDRDIELYL
jgi:hypothetical protein